MRTCAVFLALRVNVSSELRKSPFIWYFALGCGKVFGRTHFWTDSCMSGCSASCLRFLRLGRPSRWECLWQGHLPDLKTMTKWFYSTRLETRTKESNICASSRVVKPACVMKVTAGIFAPATDQSTERGLSMSTCVRTRKMVNYACEG